MKVYGHPLSTCTRRVLMTLQEKQHPYEFVIVDLMKGEQKQADHLKRHPFGVVPVIDDDGFMLYESRAIIRYLDNKLPGIKLTPQDKHSYGRMEQWIEIENAYFSKPALQLVKQLYWGKQKGEPVDESVVSTAKKQVEHAFDVAEKTLTNQPYFAGEQFSLAEITWMPYVDYLFPTGLGDLINSRPNIKKWWEDISQRQSWLKVIESKSNSK